jgi:hypothetical protein
MISNDLYYDDIRSSYICAGVVAAKIKMESTLESSNIIGCGDSILINLEKRVFAIADSPDWNQSASVRFLNAFNCLLNDKVFVNYSISWMERIDDYEMEFVEDINRLINSVDYLSPTTFSCLIVIRHHENKLKGLILHCGDSCIFKVDVKKRSVSLKSRTNFSLIGRTRKLSQVEYVDIDENTRFILCSDGVHALTRSNRKLVQLIMECFEMHDLDSIPHILIGDHFASGNFTDDVSILALDPNKLSEKNFNSNTLIFNGI